MYKHIIFAAFLALLLASCARTTNTVSLNWDNASIPGEVFRGLKPGEIYQVLVDPATPTPVTTKVYCQPCGVVNNYATNPAQIEDHKFLSPTYACAELEGPWMAGYIQMAYTDAAGTKLVSAPALFRPNATGRIFVTLKTITDGPSNPTANVFVQTAIGAD